MMKEKKARMSEVVDRLLRYVQIDTQSDPDSESWPSTAKQLDLARLLVGELEALGMADVSLDENGYVMASLHSNLAFPVPVVGLIAHLDTSPEMSGAHVHPRVVEKYAGGEIVLNETEGIVLSPRDFPDLEKFTGQDLVVTDGTTLLGADDKAGVAAIMTAMAELIRNPALPHGELRVCFTPDEEIGRGAIRFNIEAFGADLAYTVDGGEAGELNFETFNAAEALITLKGRNVHPGAAKDRMVNSIYIGMELASMLPPAARPEYTAGYEGFFHLLYFEGTVEATRLTYIIRHHDRIRFEAMKALLQASVDFITAKYGERAVQLTMNDQYPNMREMLEKYPEMLETAVQATREAGLEARIIPIRGGTDGARLTERGLPTPNLFTGGMNYHSRYEYAPVQGMEKSVEVILGIIRLYAGREL
ncbi:MAG: peptidase T [Anaerolineaceae bacterium]|nr:peptidase T [Anaerolineaceae bacterium]